MKIRGLEGHGRPSGGAFSSIKTILDRGTSAKDIGAITVMEHVQPENQTRELKSSCRVCRSCLCGWGGGVDIGAETTRLGYSYSCVLFSLGVAPIAFVRGPGVSIVSSPFDICVLVADSSQPSFGSCLEGRCWSWGSQGCRSQAHGPLFTCACTHCCGDNPMPWPFEAVGPGGLHMRSCCAKPWLLTVDACASSVVGPGVLVRSFGMVSWGCVVRTRCLSIRLKVESRAPIRQMLVASRAVWLTGKLVASVFSVIKRARTQLVCRYGGRITELAHFLLQPTTTNINYYISTGHNTIVHHIFCSPKEFASLGDCCLRPNVEKSIQFGRRSLLS